MSNSNYVVSKRPTTTTKILNNTADLASKIKVASNFINNIFGSERVDVLFKLLGNTFVNWSIENGKNIDKLFICN